MGPGTESSISPDGTTLLAAAGGGNAGAQGISGSVGQALAGWDKVFSPVLGRAAKLVAREYLPQVAAADPESRLSLMASNSGLAEQAAAISGDRTRGPMESC